MFAKISSLGLFGLNAFPVDVEIDISRGNPQFDIVGLPDTVVKESRERIRATLRSCSISFPVASVMVNLAPADTRKSGSVHDMAIFMAVLEAMRLIDVPTDGCSFIGEISLNGDIRRINGVLPMVMLARELGIRSVFVPNDNAAEASVIDGIDIYAVSMPRNLSCTSGTRKNSRLRRILLRPMQHTTRSSTSRTSAVSSRRKRHLK